MVLCLKLYSILTKYARIIRTTHSRYIVNFPFDLWSSPFLHALSPSHHSKMFVTKTHQEGILWTSYLLSYIGVNDRSITQPKLILITLPPSERRDIWEGKCYTKIIPWKFTPLLTTRYCRTYLPSVFTAKKFNTVPTTTAELLGMISCIPGSSKYLTFHLFLFFRSQSVRGTT